MFSRAILSKQLLFDLPTILSVLIVCIDLCIVILLLISTLGKYDLLDQLTD
jgi:hypothetical protein